MYRYWFGKLKICDIPINRYQELVESVFLRVLTSVSDQLKMLEIPDLIPIILQ